MNFRLFLAAAAMTAILSASARPPTAAELGERFQRTQSEADRAAWVDALDREGHDFKRRARAKIGERGIYKFNRESKLVYVVLRKTEKPGDSWDEDVAPDGRIHFEWKRKPNGGIDYSYTAPTNWDVFVSAYPGEVTRYAAKVVKADYRIGDPMPEVKMPEGWRIVKGEEYSGANVREAFFTFEKDGTNQPPPMVSLNWNGVKIRSVHGARDAVVDGETARFVPTARKAPMGFGTGFPRIGAIATSVVHHIPGMQAGPYRDYPFPSNEVAAADNFVFALRDGFRRIGFDKKEAMDGHVWLGTFDSHFPNGHTDFPPHFHIIANARDGQQVSHFYVDRADGRITADHMQDMSRVMDVWDRVFRHAPGDEWPAYDGKGRVAYRVKILPDGTGLQIWTGDRSKTFRVAGKRPCDGVDVLLPDGDSWRSVLHVAVKDDPVNGVMETPDGVVRYDPVTGARKEASR